MKRYFGNFDSREDVFRAFSQSPDGERIVVAGYFQEDYEGSAFVLYWKGGELFEIHGGHCSCNGLEDQWSPEKVTKKELRARLRDGGGFGVGPELEDEVRRWLKMKKVQ